MGNKKTFTKFKKELISEIWKRFGLTQNDSRYDSDKVIKLDFEAGYSVDDCCNWLEDKDDLNRIDIEPFTQKKIGS